MFVQSDPLVRTALWQIAQTLKIDLFTLQDAFITAEYKVSTLGGGGVGGGNRRGPTHYSVNKV